ncbi:hypothetical protein ACLB2K_075586 [Fragaria x ananassa]
MAKGVYLLFAAAIVALIVLSPFKPRHHGHHRRLGFTCHVPIFDPLVSKMERYVEEKGLEDHNHTIDTEHDLVIANDVEEAQQYLNEAGNLNLTMRLVNLFPLLDVAPEDGFVSYDELKHWIVAQAMERMIYRTRRVMAENDRDGDRAISFREYLPQFSIEDIDRNDMEHGEAGWWKQQFDNADADRNGLLTFSELKERMDHDKDGKLSFVEFSDNAYNVFKNYVEFETSDVPIAKEKFAELDVNKNKFLEAEELRPILHYLYPGELTYATYYTSFLIHEADDNKDGKLTLEEMLHHEDVFYNTVYESSDDDDIHDDHDEF